MFVYQQTDQKKEATHVEVLQLALMTQPRRKQPMYPACRTADNITHHAL